MFGNRFILIDGERFKKEPWIALEDIERKLKLEPYFTQNRFGQREDGFYCLKSPTKASISCIQSKGKYIFRRVNYLACQVRKELLVQVKRKCHPNQNPNLKISTLHSIQN